MDEVVQNAAARLLEAPTDQPLALRVQERAATRLVERVDAFAHRIGDALQKGAAAFELLLRAVCAR